MAHLYMIRHGETEYNRKGIVQGGGIDADLNEKGRSQGKAFFDYYRDTKFDKVYCTGLKRTYQTVQFFEELGKEIIVVPELNEFGWGIMEGVEGSKEVRAEFDRILTAWKKGDLDAKVPEGESPIEAWARAQVGINRIVAENQGDTKVLVCSHGRIMRVFLSQMLGYGLDRMDLFPHTNTALNLVQTLSGGKFRAEKLNDLSHLQ